MKDVQSNIARLDGYLYGLSSTCGAIGQYLSGAIFLNSKDTEEDIGSAIIDHFPTEAGYRNIDVNRIDAGLAGLEMEIQSYLLVDTLNEEACDKALSDRRKYISFKIMDMIDMIICDAREPSVYRISADVCTLGSSCEFFAVFFNEGILLIQFLRSIETSH